MYIYIYIYIYIYSIIAQCRLGSWRSKKIALRICPHFRGPKSFELPAQQPPWLSHPFEAPNPSKSLLSSHWAWQKRSNYPYGIHLARHERSKSLLSTHFYGPQHSNYPFSIHFHPVGVQINKWEYCFTLVSFTLLCYPLLWYSSHRAFICTGPH